MSDDFKSRLGELFGINLDPEFKYSDESEDNTTLDENDDNFCDGEESDDEEDNESEKDDELASTESMSRYLDLYGSTPPLRHHWKRKKRKPVVTVERSGGRLFSRSESTTMTTKQNYSSKFYSLEETQTGDDSNADDDGVVHRSLDIQRKTKKKLQRKREFERTDKEMMVKHHNPIHRTESLPPLLTTEIQTIRKFNCLQTRTVETRTPRPISGPAWTEVVNRPEGEKESFMREFSKMLSGDKPDAQHAERQVHLLTPDAAHERTRQVSREGLQVYEVKLLDKLWLELQSWFSDRTVEDQDTWLCCQRSHASKIVQDVTDYTFTSPELDSDMEAGIKILNIGSHAQLWDSDVTVDGNIPTVCTSMPEDCEPCQGCLDVFCKDCVGKQNAALKQVKSLLDQLEWAERLYPSSQAFQNEDKLYGSPEFSRKVKVLCMWYNITRFLRMKVDLIGRILETMSVKNVAWPSFNEDQPEMLLGKNQKDSYSMQVSRVPSTDSSINEMKDEVDHKPGKKKRSRPSVETTPEAEEVEIKEKKKSGKQVSFVQSVSDSSGFDEQMSSNPSDSNNSSSSDKSKDREKDFLFISTIYSPRYHKGSLEAVDLSPYRQYVDKLLKTRGLRYLISQLKKILNDTLYRTFVALEDPGCDRKARMNNGKDFLRVPMLFTELPPKDTVDEIAFHGTRTKEFKMSNLPSFRAIYYFLCRVSLDVLFECLKIRLSQQPEKPSSLSIRQLMRECKETLRASLSIRAKFRFYVHALELDEAEQEEIEKYVDKFDAEVVAMFKQYVKYVKMWVVTMYTIEEPAGLQQNFIEEEWAFVKLASPHIKGGEVLAAQSFCDLGRVFLELIGSFVEKGLKSHTAKLPAISDADCDDECMAQKKFAVCRDIQGIWNSALERSRKAITFVKTLRNDLEIAAQYKMSSSSCANIYKVLHSLKFIRLVAPGDEGKLLFVPGHLEKRKDFEDYIWELMDMTFGHIRDRCKAETDEETDPSLVREKQGFLIILSCIHTNKCSLEWMGRTLTLNSQSSTINSLPRTKVQGLTIVAQHSSQLADLRKYLAENFPAGTIMLEREQIAMDTEIVDAIRNLQAEAVKIGPRLAKSLQDLEENLDAEALKKLEEPERGRRISRYRDMVHLGYRLVFEYYNRLPYVLSGCRAIKARLSKLMVEFSRQWIAFVQQWYERGQGRRPQWSREGFQFIKEAVNVENTRHLTTTEFAVFKDEVARGTEYVIGQERPNYKASKSMPMGSPDVRRKHKNMRPSGRSHSTVVDPCLGSPHKSLSSPEISQEMLSFDDEKPLGEGIPEIKMRKIRQEIENMEREREEEQRKLRRIGMVSSQTPQHRDHLRSRAVKFSWQRGILIGQGRFGKVYTAVNNETGELLAMKEMRRNPRDERLLKQVADELRIFEGIVDRYLVQYHGVEIHREAMLIFMEYCNEGTLESLAASCNGLEEGLVRRYTFQLLSAIYKLHSHGIVHRDIKGANIFLTEEGNSLKLGDFGTAAKLSAGTTLPGEMQALAGTIAFMAPEVFSRPSDGPSGYGRQADVWSLGCTIIEMTTGKRPWTEFGDRDAQIIMFRVGSGACPSIPEGLSDEGSDFMEKCLVHDPVYRAKSEELLIHPFVKVIQDEESMAEDAFKFS